MSLVKMLLLKDVDKLGRKGEIVTSRPGYFRNYLLPQGFAETATQQALRKQARLQEERRQQAILDRSDAENTAAVLMNISLTKIVKVDHEGHMYGSVSPLDIAHMIKEHSNIELERRSISLKHPIKQVGKYTIPIKLKEGVTADVRLEVLPEGAQQEAAPQENEATQ